MNKTMTDIKENKNIPVYGEAEDILAAHGVRPTVNRILVVRALQQASAPMSLTQLEERLESLDKSSIFRALMVLREAHVAHDVEDGRGVTLYELCGGHDSCSPADMHVHFYCERCGKVECFPTVAAPAVDVPSGYELRTVNYMLKGLCPDCVRRKKY